jgi:glyoxylase-like metal-dependent hydrolase (beta-lactamase superfamily II)
MDFRIISIGTLDSHPLWNERAPVRTGHATTTLVRADKANILIDPGLPGQIIEARLAERANLKPADITHVFLTCFRPDVRRGLELFDKAAWLISEAEREQVGVALIQSLQHAADGDDPALTRALERDVALLQRCAAAPDLIAQGVSPFPLPGVTPGMCGVLLAHPRFTVLVCGDAVPTIEHLEQGQVVRWAVDVKAAQESFSEAVEIADLLILGRDNIAVNPVKRPF